MQLYDELIDEFMDAVKTRYGDKVLVQVAIYAWTWALMSFELLSELFCKMHVYIF